MRYLPKDNVPEVDKLCDCCGQKLRMTRGNLSCFLLKCLNYNCRMYCTPQGYITRDESDRTDYVNER